MVSRHIKTLLALPSVVGVQTRGRFAIIAPCLRPKSFVLGAQVTIRFLVMSVISVFLIGCSPKDCNKWEYASLNLSSNSIIDGDEVKAVNFIVIWNSNDGSITWYDSQPISGGTDLDLKTFFGARANHPISVLNALGTVGWEAYDYERRNQNESIELTDWQLKRCVK